MPNPSFPTVPASIRFRLVIAVPLVLLCFTIAAGWTVIFYFDRPAPDPVFARLFILGWGILGAGIGLILALAITKPLRQVTSLAERFSLVPGEQAGTDEVDSLVRAFSRMMLSMDRFISDSYILESLLLGIVSTDAGGRILYANAAARQMLGSGGPEGFESPDVVGQPVTAFIARVPGNEEVLALLEQAYAGTLQDRGEAVAVLRTRSGEVHRGLVEITPFRRPLAGDQVAAVIGLRSYEEREQIREQIRQADRLILVGFLASTLVHELKNPLGAIRGLAELLQEDFPEGDAKRNYTAGILDAIRRMERLISEILAMIRMEQEERVAVNLAELIGESLAGSAAEINRKQLQVIRELPPALPVVHARKSGLLQAIQNILENAVQASPPGGQLTITASCRAGQNAGPASVVLCITNSGSYIPLEKQEQIFLPFVTTKKGGTGLGLFIARQYVESQGGSIGVKSTPEQGTTFEIRLAAA